jgi:hypothetical protein
MVAALKDPRNYAPNDYAKPCHEFRPHHANPTPLLSLVIITLPNQVFYSY